ncbi:MAG: hypothetical protein ABSE69_11020 [Roseiarcus sp.]|jgi:hypothetical protein
MVGEPRIKITDLLQWYTDIPPKHRSDIEAGAIISIGVIRHYLGPNWLNSKVLPKRSTSRFMAIDDNIKDVGERQIQYYKLIDLAESLYNLQYVDNFDECVARLKTGDPESYIAELNLGMLLYINKHTFKFMERQQKKKCDYDVEVKIGSWTVCIEAKCKIESTKPSETSVLSALSYGRRQLPKDNPGILFVKIPPSWTKKFLLDQWLQEISLKYLRFGTEKIVAIIYYVAPYAYNDKTLIQAHEIRQIFNPNNRFDRTIRWNLLNRHSPPIDSSNAMPRHWLRLANFPKGLKAYDDPRIGMIS